MLYFGTGRYFLSGDNNASLGQQVQSLYGVWDNGTAISANWRTDGLLVGQQMESEGTTPETRSVTNNPVSYLVQRGWYLDLVVDGNDTGERFIATPRIQSGKVYLPTYQPGFASDCAPGGKNWLYALDPLSGGAAFGQITLPPNGTVGGSGTGAITTGDGAPSRGVGVTQPVPITPVYCDPSNPLCVPGDENNPPNTQCSEVIIDASDPTKSLVVQRACGRQSWRQLL
jgi:type IV pilus assembly protein PilY1